MASDWIKIEKATPGKPEVLQVADQLGIHPDHAFGLCVRFWFWCDDQMNSCHAPSVTSVTLDYVFGHPGFVQSLINVGWLRVRNGSLEVPNFDRHLSESAKKRADSLRRKRKQRSKDASSVSQESVTKVTPPLSLSLSSTEEPIRKIFDLEKAFESFWKAYPCKQSKKPARNAFEKAILRLEKQMPKATAAEKLTIAASDYARFIDEAIRPPSVKYAQGWLNDDRFEDDFETLLREHNAIEERGVKGGQPTFAQLRINNTKQAGEEFVNDDRIR